EKGGLKSFKEGKFEEELGNPDRKGSLKIKGSFLIKDEVVFPLPMDLLKGKRENDLHNLTLSKRPEIFISDYIMDKVLICKETEDTEKIEGYITAIYLHYYLSGRNSLRFIGEDEIYTVEPKTGITRNDTTKSTMEGFLYRIPMIRLKKDVSIAVLLDGITAFPESGIIQLGGEGKTARIEKIENNMLQEIEEINLNLENRLFKVYLATPTIFEKGYLPKWIDENSLNGRYNGIELKLVCCAIGKCKLIGGWDMAKNKPKPSLKAVPAGSVYYFEILDNSDIKKIKDTFHFKNISDVYPEEGYGLALIGSVL
ncbi:MAG: type III-B CRISPR module-associated protein Cmr3, partial [Candidatus Omnitrophica bacterium]|nr:type III-B CRISPR module-associated protein Cmr3 [Candidatus Omnitrophota bacterium]